MARVKTGGTEGVWNIFKREIFFLRGEKTGKLCRVESKCTFKGEKGKIINGCLPFSVFGRIVSGAVYHSSSSLLFLLPFHFVTAAAEETKQGRGGRGGGGLVTGGKTNGKVFHSLARDSAKMLTAAVFSLSDID